MVASLTLCVVHEVVKQKEERNMRKMCVSSTAKTTRIEDNWKEEKNTVLQKSHVFPIVKGNEKKIENTLMSCYVCCKV